MRTVPKLIRGKRYLITFPQSRIPSKIGNYIRTVNGTDFFEVDGVVERFDNEPDGLYPMDEQYYLLDVPSLQELALEKLPKTEENDELVVRMGLRGGKRKSRRGLTRNRTRIARTKA